MGLRQIHPVLLWINLAGVATGSGNSKDRHRYWNLVRFTQDQLTFGAAVLCGNARSNGWEMPSTQQLCLDDRLHTTLHRWCRIGIKDNISHLPSSAVSRLLCNLSLEACDTCQCPQHAGRAQQNSDFRTTKWFADTLHAQFFAILAMPAQTDSYDQNRNQNRVWWRLTPLRHACGRKQSSRRRKPQVK